jgi:hypothetical protein
VIGVQPSVIEMAALGCGTKGDHKQSPALEML